MLEVIQGLPKSISRFSGTFLNIFGGVTELAVCALPSATRPRAQKVERSWRKPALRAKVIELAPILWLICLYN